jgi:hypothetical protein
MNPGQRLGRIGAVVAAAIALIVLLVTAGSRHGPAHRTGSGANRATERNSASVSATTVDLAPVTAGTALSVAHAPVAVSTTVPPPTTTTVAAPTALGAAGAYLVPPAQAHTRTGDPANCGTFADPGWSARCGLVNAAGGDLLWLIESAPAPAGTAFRVFTLRHLSGQSWSVALIAADEGALREWVSVGAVAADVTGDGYQDAVYGFHGPGPSNWLVVEVVSRAGQVNLHRLYQSSGSLTYVTGQLDGWWLDSTSAPYHEELRFLSGAWRIVAQASANGVHPPSAV